MEALLLKTLRAWSNESSRQKLTEALSSKSADVKDLKEELQQARLKASIALEEAKEATANAQVARQSALDEALGNRQHAEDWGNKRARAMELAYGRREEATRRMLSSVFASQLESLLRQVMDAWRAAKAERLRLESVEKQTREVEMMRTQLQELRVQIKEAPSAKEQPSPTQEKDVVKMATELLKSEASQMLMMRKEEALRRWVSSFLASQTETLLLNMLRTWRSLSMG
eukprot:g2720.t1